MRRITGVASLLALSLVLVGCAADVESTGNTPNSGGANGPQDAGAVEAAEALVKQRYELVRDGDYAAVCELYSDEFFALFAELANASGDDCVAAHEAAIASSETYLAEAEAQGRTALAPFFYVPTEIEIDSSAISASAEDVAFLGPGTVTSLDPREFEGDKTPGWLRANDYIKQDSSGAWHFIAMTEQ